MSGRAEPDGVGGVGPGHPSQTLGTGRGQQQQDYSEMDDDFILSDNQIDEEDDENDFTQPEPEVNVFCQ